MSENIKESIGAVFLLIIFASFIVLMNLDVQITMPIIEAEGMTP